MMAASSTWSSCTSIWTKNWRKLKRSRARTQSTSLTWKACYHRLKRNARLSCRSTSKVYRSKRSTPSSPISSTTPKPKHWKSDRPWKPTGIRIQKTSSQLSKAKTFRVWQTTRITWTICLQNVGTLTRNCLWKRTTSISERSCLQQPRSTDR